MTGIEPEFMPSVFGVRFVPLLSFFPLFIARNNYRLLNSEGSLSPKSSLFRRNLSHFYVAEFFGMFISFSILTLALIPCVKEVDSIYTDVRELVWVKQPHKTELVIESVEPFPKLLSNIASCANLCIFSFQRFVLLLYLTTIMALPSHTRKE